MRLTTKGRFAVTAMIDLALRQDKGPVALSRISERQSISLSYLEQLFGRLRKHELVSSCRGPGGGYRLGRKSSDITVADIIYAVDEPLDATQCGGKQNCKDDDVCMKSVLFCNFFCMPMFWMRVRMIFAWEQLARQCSSLLLK